jgi:hypothetical protein
LGDVTEVSDISLETGFGKFKGIGFDKAAVGGLVYLGGTLPVLMTYSNSSLVRFLGLIAG